MSQEGHTVLNVSEGSSVTNLTLVVLLLIPCVVILLLLNCLLLGYKLLDISRRRRREDAQDTMVRLQRVRGLSGVSSLQDTRTAYMSLSEPVFPQPVTSSRASSRAAPDHRIRLLRPDGATGSGSLRAPSTIRTASSSPAVLGPRPVLQPGSRTYRSRKNRCKSAPVLPQSSYSEAESRVNLVPPNSPTEPHLSADVHQSSPYTFLTDADRSVAQHLFDKADQEYVYNESPSQSSCFNTSALGTGLDSDFGASAGVSLRILSADSDGLSNGVLTSALEWDYYDPCYVKQNHVQKRKYHRPAIHIKQYWV